MDILYVATALAIFLAVALLVEGLFLWWNARFGAQARALARRLHGLAPVGDEQRAALLPRAGGGGSGLSRLLAQSGARQGGARFCLLSLAGAGAAAVLLGALGVALPAVLACAALAGAMPLLLALRRRARRQARMEAQLPEALELLSRAMRAGHALPSALKMAADELPDPLGAEFRTLFNEINYGVPVQDAMRNLAARVPGSDAGFFVVAVLIQRETGGNLAELLDGIARIVRERLKLLAQVEVFSAEGRLSAWILGLLPFFLGAVLYLVNPGFMAILWSDPGGMKMLGAVLVLMAAGVAWMRSVIRIRV